MNGILKVYYKNNITNIYAGAARPSRQCCAGAHHQFLMPPPRSPRATASWASADRKMWAAQEAAALRANAAEDAARNKAARRAEAAERRADDLARQQVDHEAAAAEAVASDGARDSGTLRRSTGR